MAHSSIEVFSAKMTSLGNESDFELQISEVHREYIYSQINYL